MNLLHKIVKSLPAILITTSENSEEDSNTSSVAEKTTTTSSTAITTAENLSATTTEYSSDSSQTYRLFFYNPVDGTRYYVDEDITVEENALVSALTSALQNSNYNSDFIVLSDQIGVSNATVDTANSALTVKFNDSFEKYMNLDPASAYELIYTLVNTYAYNYKVNKISLYFNDIQYTAAQALIKMVGTLHTLILQYLIIRTKKYSNP